MFKTDYFIWVDFETTGSDPLTDDVLEYAFVFTHANDPTGDYVSLGQVHRFGYNPSAYDFSRWDPVVQKMHIENGLLAELNRRVESNEEEVEEEVLSWLKRGFRYTFAGSGISRFDRVFIKRTMPNLDKRTTYWDLDIGQIRRTLRGFGVEIMEPERPHRAMADVIDAIAEFKSYRYLIMQAFNSSPQAEGDDEFPYYDEEAEKHYRIWECKGCGAIIKWYAGNDEPASCEHNEEEA